MVGCKGEFWCVGGMKRGVEMRGEEELIEVVMRVESYIV